MSKPCSGPGMTSSSEVRRNRDKVYSASTVQAIFSGAAYREIMEGLMDKVYSASTGYISGAAYRENRGANGQGLQCKYRLY